MTIFVSVASYRDPETLPTIKDAINKAQYPDRLRFGVCLQQEKNEYSLDITNHNHLIKYIEYNWRESLGACWARHNIQKFLYNQENYYLQLDSHHRFIPYWDSILIEHIERLESVCDKPIIGGYCQGYKVENDQTLDFTPMKIQSFADFTTEGDLQFYPKAIPNHEALLNNNKKYIPARFLSGHFIFTRGNFIEECPYDINLYFRGEELSLSARAYTSGYDFFHPAEPIIWHQYIRADQKKHWSDHTKLNGFVVSGEDRSNKAKKRVRQLLGMEHKNKSFGKFDLGTKRSLHEYELYAGLNLKNKQVHKYAYNLNNTYPDPFIMNDNEWKSGLMNKFKVEFMIPKSYLEELDIEDLDFLAVIYSDYSGTSVYRKDLKDADILNIYNTHKFLIHSSMENSPTSVVIIPFSKSTKTFLSNQKYHIKEIRVYE